MAADTSKRSLEACQLPGLFRRVPNSRLSSKRRDFICQAAFLSAWLLIMVMAAITLGCSSKTQEAWIDLTDRGSGYDFKPISFDVPPFTLAGLLKYNSNASADLVVYLEGDGRGVVRGRVSPDPTPSKAMGFELAKSDPASSVLYLARVGQFQPDQTGKKYQEYWSNKRLSAESVRAASQAIDRAKAQVGAQRLHLIGYSGGGGLAVLLAEQRPDVASLVTVAGLLDTNWWVREKNFQPLTGSLNPADQAMRISHIPQVHFYGSEDSIIPPAMSAHFQTLAPFTSFKRVEVDTNHWRVWPEVWPNLLSQHALSVRKNP